MKFQLRVKHNVENCFKRDSSTGKDLPGAGTL